MLFESAIITRGSGSIGGLTASHNKGGNYFRARVTPTDPATPFQVTVRSIMAALVNAWNDTLNQAERDNWAVYAANTQLLNPFGEPRTVTGLNMYTRVNVPRLQAGRPRVDNAPLLFNTGEFTQPAVSFSAGSGTSVIFNPTDLWVSETGSLMLLYLSRPQNPGIVFFKGPYRFAGFILGDTAMPPVPPVVITPNPFPLTPGQRVFAKMNVARIDGRYSTTIRVTGIVAA